MSYNWKLIRICSHCGKEYEQNIENYLRMGAMQQMHLVVPGLVLTQKWHCSDCILHLAKSHSLEG